MKQIRTEEAVGHIICHDITRIIKDVEKDVAFRKGHIVREEDIPVLLSLGKEHLYIWENDPSKMHENEAALVLCEICQNDHMKASAVKEGKIELSATRDGVFVVDEARLLKVNTLGEMMIATRHSYTPVKEADRLMGMRIIPLVIEREKMAQATAVAGNQPIAKIMPYKSLKVGVVTTGSEVYHGRIKDTFTPVIRTKLEAYGSVVTEHITVTDDLEHIKNAILTLKRKGVELIICTGGMSVDPDDLTPGAIKATGATIISYGAPVLPGAMFLLGYFEDGVPIMGLPGCAMYNKTTVVELILPRVLAGILVSAEDIARLGHGGLCLGCTPCVYPNCSFGK